MPDDFIAFCQDFSARVVGTHICQWLPGGHLALLQMHGTL
jgi:hypothetical protein